MDDLYLIKTENTVPYDNLALEEALLKSVKPGEVLLYLWQNRQTVVIGRNQNASAECRIRSLENDGGFLARRLSGGGAVYHDTGNLNFTFIACSGSFDKAKQTDVILEAVRGCGIKAEKNGRNDLTADGRKFSGHAYYRTKGRCYHHGTLMLYVDKKKLEEYLNVSGLKLSSKGVRSVRSRVVNLCELDEGLTVERLSESLVEAFAAVYGGAVKPFPTERIDSALLSELSEKYSSPEWKYGNEKVLEHSIERKFEWGLTRLDYGLTESTPYEFSDVRFYSDGLEAEYLYEISERLASCRLDKESVMNALIDNTGKNKAYDESMRGIAEDISAMIAQISSEVT